MRQRKSSSYAHPVYEVWLAGRYARLRFPKSATLHSDVQLKNISAASLPKFLLMDRGMVKSGFALAQRLNRQMLGEHVKVFSYPNMTKASVQRYVKFLKVHARVYKWTKEMLAIELQYLKG
jgi:hypothetical protein